MEGQSGNPSTLWLSIPLVLTVAIASICGIITDDFYYRETPNWALQSRGQDIIDLVLAVPVLLVAAIFAYRGNRKAVFIWGGAVLYFVYTFVIYALAVHFNSMFLVYCASLGLAFYAMMYFIRWLAKTKIASRQASTVLIRTTAIYFLVLAIAFTGMWLSSIIPDLRSAETPASLVETGLYTNPVHVIDLAVFLPGVFITGIMLWRQQPLGLALAPVLLTFFVLMNITIAFLHLMMMRQGMAANQVLVYIMGALALWSLYLVYKHLHNIEL